jgi:hypothetical protein
VVVGDDRLSCPALRSEKLDENGCKQGTHMGTRTVYRIVVDGELSERYAIAFEGMEMEVKSGRTILTGEVIDQPHLHGILDRIGALGLQLVSVEDLTERQGDEPLNLLRSNRRGHASRKTSGIRSNDGPRKSGT